MARFIAGFFSALAGGFILFLTGTLFLDGLPAVLSGSIFEPGYWEFRSSEFSAWSMFFGSASITFLALVLAFPVGLGAAVFVSEFLTGRARVFFKVTIELLAGIPSVVYGLIGIVFFLPFLQPFVIRWGGVSGDSLFAAGVLLAVMILPTVMTFSDDALRCVPLTLREEGLGLGLSRLQVITSVVLPGARSGIAGAVMLGTGRAVGETIAVYLVIGRLDQRFSPESLSFRSLMDMGQSITTKLGGAELAIAYGDRLHWQALMGLALCLWLVAGLVGFLSEFVVGPGA